MPRALIAAVSGGAAQGLAARVTGVLSEPEATKYVSAFPPLLLASLTPGTQLGAIALPARQRAAKRSARSILTPEATAELNYWFQVTAAGVAGAAQDAGAELAGEGLGVLAGEFVAAGVAAPVALLVGVGWVAYSGYTAWEGANEILLTRDGVLAPARLEVTPAVEALPAEAQVKYTVTGIDADNKNVGPVSYQLSVLPDGFCSHETCYVTTAGKHAIVAADGGARGYAKLNVVPGPIEGLFFSPADLDITLPPGEHAVLYQPLDGVDHWMNDISPVVIGSGVGEATLTVTDGACIVDTCIVKTPGVHTVTAQVGTVTKTTTLTVEEIKINPTTLAEATEGELYSATLSAEGGEAPYTWAVTAGSLPKGLGLDPSTGIISGAPTTAENSNFEVTVTDKGGATKTAQYGLAVKRGSHQCGNVCVLPAPGDGVTLIWHQSASAEYEYVAKPWIDGVEGGCKLEQGQGCDYGLGLTYPKTEGGGFTGFDCRGDGEVAECTWAHGELGLLPGEVIYFEVVAEKFSEEPFEILLGTSKAVTIE
jgi:hypothetical protein